MNAGVDDFLHRLTHTVAASAGDGLVGVYAVGSLATGGWTAGVSDIDVLVAAAPDRADLEPVADAVVSLGGDVPAPKLELVVYDMGVLRRPRHPLPYLLNVNVGPALATRVSRGGDPAHWFLLDLAIARDSARPYAGPPLEALAGSVPRGEVLAAVRDALAWHRAHGSDPAATVLNACRSWRFAVDGVWTSKAAAARWARGRLDAPAVVDAALRARAGGRPPSPGAAAALLDTVSSAVGAASAAAGSRARGPTGRA